MTQDLASILRELARGQLVEVPPPETFDPEDREAARLLAVAREQWLRERGGALAESVVSLEQLKRAQSELKAVQAELVEASKLTALGTLAAGIAHEMNQPLALILGLVELMLEGEREQVSDYRDELEHMLGASENLAQIINNVLTFARQTSLERRPVLAKKPLGAALQLLGRSLANEGIDLTVDLDDAETFLSLNESRMQQVFVNLLLNARDAVRETAATDQRIRVSTGVRNGSFIYEITDNGSGVEPAHVDRLFEPFFTTKQPGAGIGLGLSLSHGIVSEHDGWLRYRRDDDWTRFEVGIPLGESDLGPARSAAAATN